MRYVLLAGTAIALHVVALTPALSQQRVGDQPTDASSDEVRSDASPSGEIVVTALRRNQSVLDAPAAISVLSKETIQAAGISRPNDFVATIPNVTISESNRAGEAFITIRGVAQARAADATVAVIIDGVQQGAAEEFNQELYDIQQIEVLKGPQGALYGRNAIGGAIVIRTAPPSDEFHASAAVSYGNNNAIKAVGTLNIPIVKDRAYLRVSGYHRETEGFFRNIVTGRKVDPARENGGKARLELMPTDELTIDIRGSFAEFSGGGINYLPQIGVLDTNDTARPYQQNIQSSDIQRRRSASVTFTYDTPEGAITLTPAYSYVKEDLKADAFPYDFAAGNTQHAIFFTRTLSSELKFSSVQDRPLTYVVGGYYANIKRRDLTQQGRDTGQGIILGGYDPHPAGSVNPTLAQGDDKYRYNVVAAFAQIGWKITDDLNLSAALRYDHEKRRTVNVTPPQFSPLSGQRRAQSFDGFEPKITLSYKPVQNVNLYADYSQGFVSGGFNPAQTEDILQATDPNSTTPNEYDKQTSKAFEVGVKSELFDRRVTANVAFFHTDIKNLQQYQFFPQANFQAISPIDKVRIRGFEVEMNARLVDGLSVFAAGGYTDAVIRDFGPNTALVGNKTPYVPKYTMNGGFQYGHEIGDLDGTLRVEAQRIGPQWFDVNNTPGNRRDAVNLVNARASIGTDAWLLSLFSRNLFNKQYNSDAILIVPTIQIIYPAQPRTYGVELKVNF
jgi:iron complex outermembrane recepter protein